VAEVTSLGLVQMTRKKIGLGLVETFSEPCEVCAGRGIIVHHDPVVKHRASAGNSRRSRPAVPTTTPVGGAHVITEGAKSALAQIVASTIHHVEGEDVPAPAADEPEHADQPAAERPKKRKKRKDKDSGRAHEPKTERDILLDSVLDALPEPKAPGQGRSRRRVTTAALTGTPVPTGTDD
jgi:ribonuclease E